MYQKQEDKVDRISIIVRTCLLVTMEQVVWTGRETEIAKETGQEIATETGEGEKEIGKEKVIAGIMHLMKTIILQ